MEPVEPMEPLERLSGSTIADGVPADWSVRLLDDADLGEVRALLERTPVPNAWLLSRIAARGLTPRNLGAAVWGFSGEGALRALCHAGSTVVPVRVDAAAADALAPAVLQHARECSSIVGPAEQVATLWSRLEPRWRRPRAVRRAQPLLTSSARSPVPLDPEVRRASAADLPDLVPACVAMYTEEIGASPLGSDGGRRYSERVAELVRGGRSYVRLDSRGIVFKTEIGAVTPEVCQLQGVWVRPDQRGRGLGTAGVAAVVADVLANVAPTVSLYVNDYNYRALRTYERCGFTRAGTFASVLF
jgi:predicted GNAT family acetyltransferase